MLWGYSLSGDSIRGNDMSIKTAREGLIEARNEMDDVDFVEAVEALRKVGKLAGLSVRKLKEALAPEPRFYEGQAVLVRDGEGDAWLKGTYEAYEEEPYHHAVLSEQSVLALKYKHCKPDPDAKEQWIEYTGPVDVEADIVLYELECGRVVKVEGPVELSNARIVRYRLINKPVYL